MRNVARCDGPKMAVILGEKSGHVQAFGGGDDRGVRQPNFQSAILGDHLAAAHKVGGGQSNQREVTLLHRFNKLKRGIVSESPVQEVVDLGQKNDREEQRAGFHFDERCDRLVLSIIGVVEAVTPLVSQITAIAPP